MDNDVKEGFGKGVANVFSFIICAAISGFAGLSLVEEPIMTIIFAIIGGFIGTIIFKLWWNGMKNSSSPAFKAFIFTIFTLIIMAGIVFIALGKV